MEDRVTNTVEDAARFEEHRAGGEPPDQPTRAEVEEVPVCRCTGEELERMASELFAPRSLNRSGTIGFRCPCGIRHTWTLR
jgi:hypothetical protein